MALHEGREADRFHVNETRGVLVVAPCRQLCDWARVPPSYDDAVLLACNGCGSQWEPGQAWTPSQADGTVPEAVSALQRG